MESRDAARRLERWFSAHGRDLPWRRDHDPYHVLLVEFLLQQTRVETGLPYYHRFLQRFPDIRSLASATETDVLAMWSGLGYYRRAKNLHRTAQRIVQDHAGRVPDEVVVLDSLPGIGAYTAGAIASIAYDLPEPAIDGNQVRVLGRFLGVRDPETPAGRRTIEAEARRMLVHASPRSLNQAIMDVGASICLPTSPLCHACPLERGCRTKGATQTRRTPVRKPTEDWEALLHARDGRLWLAAPAATGLLAGLWLPPLRRSPRAFRTADGVHAFSHRTWRLRYVRTRKRPSGRGRWVAPEELETLPHGRLTRLAMRAAFGERPTVA